MPFLIFVGMVGWGVNDLLNDLQLDYRISLMFKFWIIFQTMTYFGCTRTRNSPSFHLCMKAGGSQLQRVWRRESFVWRPTWLRYRKWEKILSNISIHGICLPGRNGSNGISITPRKLRLERNGSEMNIAQLPGAIRHLSF